METSVEIVPTSIQDQPNTLEELPSVEMSDGIISVPTKYVFLVFLGSLIGIFIVLAIAYFLGKYLDRLLCPTRQLRKRSEDEQTVEDVKESAEISLRPLVHEKDSKRPTSSQESKSRKKIIREQAESQ